MRHQKRSSPGYRINVTTAAARQLKALPADVQRRIVRRLTALSVDPRPPGAEKLHGAAGMRIRVGDYRVVYVVDDTELIVLVIRAGHRREVYRHRD